MNSDRTKRVKEARDEAKKEIEQYKKEKDDEFKKFESEVGLSASTDCLRGAPLCRTFSAFGLAAGTHCARD